MSYVYEYRVEGLQKAPAQLAGEECERLAATKEGLTPERLVEASRPTSAPLHEEFEWNDKTAADKYRKQQARCIIDNLYITVTGGEQIKTRAFVSLKETPVGAYTPMNAVLNSEQLTASLLETAKRELESFRAKYKRLAKLSGVMEAIDAVLQPAQRQTTSSTAQRRRNYV